MGLWHRVSTNPAKEELTELLVTGEDDESFEVIRDYISKEGGRKLVKNTGITLGFPSISASWVIVCCNSFHNFDKP